MSESVTSSSVSENSSSSSIPSSPSPSPSKPPPICCIVIGMAGSGKSTLMNRLLSECHTRQFPQYSMNLDPAVLKINYTPNIDIRDTVKYKEVMKQYKLGPNGGILTALNLFATRFDQVLHFAEKRAPSVKYFFLDTPGQIEVFTWSASGTIISDAMAASFPTCLLYVIDTPRTTSPVTFMSNMLYACSILYKTRLPFIVIFNKTDVCSHEFATRWMEDFEVFQEALKADSTYMGSLTRSMALVLDQFYRQLRCVGVSAVTGAGFSNLFDAIEATREDYEKNYKPALLKKQESRKAKAEEAKAESLKRLQKDLLESKGQTILMEKQRKLENSNDEAPDIDSDEEDAVQRIEYEEDENEVEDEESHQREKSEYEDFMRQLRNSKIENKDEEEEK